jgi:hypothetical protein
MIEFSDAVISDRLQALTRALDADTSLPGRLQVYSGDRPARGANAPANAYLLGALSFVRPSLDNVLQRVLTLRNPPTTLVSISGIATWARMVNGAGQFVADMDAGAIGSDAECIINSVTAQLYAGGELSVSLAKLTET